MPNHMKGCGCKRCRKGMHSKQGSIDVQKVIRKVRRKTKQKLKKGLAPDPKFSIGYTD